MPYIPAPVMDGIHGRALNLVHASLRSALSQPDPISAVPFDHDQTTQFQTLTMRGLGSYNSINATAIYAMNQQRTRQIVATTASTLSLFSALVAVFWFFMMRRNFRRDLVLLLILGGAFKSLWFVVFSVYSFVHGAVETETAFCQANGYLLQVGFEQCDAAVLFMSMHMYYQIFPTQRFGLGHDGLYRMRRWVYAAWILLPNLSAGLAFINPRSGFMAQGGFCSLPLRPFWYRIALFWGPRYLIWCYVVFVAVRIYRYVGSEFKIFGQERDRSESLGVPRNSSVDRMMKTEMEQRRRSRRFSSFGLEKDHAADVECAPDDVGAACAVRPKTAPWADSPKMDMMSSARRQSTPNWTTTVDPITEGEVLAPPPIPSYPDSRRGSQQISQGVTAEDFAPPPKLDPNGHRGSVRSLASKKSSAAASLETPSALASIMEGASVPQSLEDSRPTAGGALKLRRRLIQRQLRLLFIYPCIYMLLWVIPLVVNIMNYSDYFAQHPIFAIGILQLLCITLMSFADVVVFCWRERPWRHIPGSDGTFGGSLMFWRYCFVTQWARDRRASSVPAYLGPVQDSKEETSESKMGLLNSLKRWRMGRKGTSPRGSDASTPKPPVRPAMHRRNYSGGSERKQMEAERAHERLALERADYELNRRSLQERRVSVTSQRASVPSNTAQEKEKEKVPEKERKEWYHQDDDLFNDVELDEDEKHRPS